MINTRFALEAIIFKFEDCSYNYCSNKNCKKTKVVTDLCPTCDGNDLSEMRLIMIGIKDTKNLKLNLLCFGKQADNIKKI
jgi:hypothetical protein